MTTLLTMELRRRRIDLVLYRTLHNDKLVKLPQILHIYETYYIFQKHKNQYLSLKETNKDYRNCKLNLVIYLFCSKVKK